ncbi:hypothetical protein TSOC_014470 [Tetrabaena socialis]|uniref:Uncharacterized protein n=1 Tax=Tetrabaena socialis TaxID=47790 RepID=A0A2J7ZHL6_9CHLO|nr:hypothetical protein TSOC_014470 [Tetrabaena socialis]|eukprot:PNG99747.1 hypothetical protein TSOC_014470 [Tetrabaena socialis]
MDSLSLAAFEERASTAESRLAALEGLLASSGPPADSSALLELRALLVQAKEAAVTAEAERKQAVAERSALKDEAAKLRYQVMHLKRTVRELEAAQPHAPR